MRRITRAFKGVTHAMKDVDAILRSALLATLDRDFDRAEELLADAVRIDSSGIESFLALGRLFRMRGEIGRAIRIHQNLLLRADLEVDQRVEVLVDLGTDFRQGGFLRRAIASYEEVLSRDPKHLVALRALFHLLADVREFGRALEVARRLSRIEGDKSGHREAELYVDMAVAAHREGRNDDARKAVKRAIRKDRDLVRAWIELGDLEAERGRTKAALAAWVRVPEVDPASGEQVYPKLETAYSALGKGRDFEKLLRTFLDERPDDSAARLALARALAARGEIDDGVSELRRIIESDPGDLEATAALGRVLLAEGRDAEAAHLLGEVLDALDQRGLLASTKDLE
ncbi:MAG: tetratricopeptide repeat protein [Deltaproteobacteria bacterium]|nr:tetratricopeptide repeat protein [Deltaproteobacteria bacterium]